MSSQSLSLPAPVPTGVDGLDVILDGGLTPHRLYLIEGVPGSGKTTMALQFLLEGVARGETRAVRDALGDRGASCAKSAHSHGWSLDGIDDPRAVPGRRPARSRSRSTRCSIRPKWNWPRPPGAILRRGRAPAARSRRVRLAGRAAPAGRVAAALPPPGAGAEAVLRRQAARTVLLLDESPAAEQGLQVQTHRARRDPAGAAACRIRRRPPAPAGQQDARPRLPRRLPRLHDRDRRRAGVSAPGRRASTGASGEHAPVASGTARTGRAARRRPGSRHQHAADRRRRHRQVVAGRAFRAGRRASAASARRCSCSTRAMRTLLTRSRGHRLRPASATSTPARSTCSRSTRPSSRRASSSSASATRWKRTARTLVVHRQPQRLPQRDARGALRAACSCTSCSPTSAQLGVATLLINAQQGLIGADATSPSTSATSPTRWCCCATSRPRRGAPGDLGPEEARRPARAHDPRDAHRQRRHLRVGEPLREFRGVLTGVPQEVVGTTHGPHARSRWHRGVRPVTHRTRGEHARAAAAADGARRRHHRAMLERRRRGLPCCRDAATRWREHRRTAPARCWSPKRRWADGAARSCWRSARRAAALVRFAGADPARARGADSLGGRRRGGDARQRHAARAARCAWPR